MEQVRVVDTASGTTDTVFTVRAGREESSGDSTDSGALVAPWWRHGGFKNPSELDKLIWNRIIPKSTE